MPKNKPKNKVKNSSLELEYQSNSLEITIEHFAYNKESQTLPFASELTEKSKIESIHLVHQILLYCTNALIHARQNDWDNAIPLLLEALGRMNNYDLGGKLGSIHCKLIFKQINELFLHIARDTFNKMQQPSIIEIMNVMVGDYRNVHRRFFEKISSNKVIQEDSTKFSESYMKHRNKFEVIKSSLETVSVFNDWKYLLREGNVFCNFVSVIGDTLLQIQYNAVKLTKKEDPQYETWTNVQKITMQRCIEQLKTQANWETNSQQVSMAVFVHRLLMQFHESKIFFEFSKLIEKSLIDPAAKRIDDCATKALIQYFKIDRLAVEYVHENKFLGNAEALFHSTQDLLLKEETAKIDSDIHASHVFLGLMLFGKICGNKFADMARYKSRNEDSISNKERVRKRFAKQGTQNLLSPIAKLDLLNGCKEISDQLLSSLLFLSSSPQAEFALKFKLPLPSFSGYLLVYFDVLPRCIELKRDVLENTKSDINTALVQWQETLNDLKQVYQTIEIALNYFLVNPNCFTRSEEFFVFTRLLKERVFPELNEINEETTQLQEKIQSFTKQISEATANQELLEQLEKKSKLRIHKPMIKEKSSSSNSSAFIQSTEQVEDEEEFTLSVSSQTEITQKSAIDHWNHGFYHAAKEEFRRLGEISEKHFSESLEGMLSCQAKLLIKQLQFCTQLLNRIAINPRQVNPDHAQQCYEQVKLLGKEYDAVLLQYDDCIKEITHEQGQWENSSQQQDRQTGMQYSISWLNEERQELADAWLLCENMRDKVSQYWDISRFNKVMMLGFVAKEISNEKVRERLYNIGYKNIILKNSQEPINSADYKLFDAVYEQGKKVFIQKGKENQEKFGESIYSLHIRLLEKYQEVLQHGIKPCNTSSSSSSRHTRTEPVTGPVLTNTNQWQSTDELLKFLCNTILLSNEEEGLICHFMQIQLAMAASEVSYKQSFSPSLAYELICTWLIHSQLTTRYQLLDKLGLLDLLIPLDPQSASNRVKKRHEIMNSLAKIAKNIATTPFTQLNNNRILGQILSVILSHSVSPEHLAFNLKNWSDQSMSLAIICKNLQLSVGCKGILYCFLSGHLSFDKTPTQVLPPILAKLQQTAILQVQRLLKEGDISEDPWYIMIYGGASLASLTLSGHIPSDTDLQTNIPLKSLPFSCQSLEKPGHQNLYRLINSDLSIDPYFSIRIVSAPLLDELMHLDFSIHQICYDLLLQQHVFWTEEAVTDLRDERLSSLKSLEHLPINLDILLRFLISGINYKFYASEENTQQIRTYLNQTLLQEKANEQLFAAPIFDKSILYQFLLSRLTQGKSSAYITLANHYGLLPFLFAIPVTQTFSYSSMVTMERKLQDIDRDLSLEQSGDSNPANSRLLRIIAVVIFCSCETREVMNMAIKQTCKMLDCDPAWEIKINSEIEKLDYARPRVSSKSLFQVKNSPTLQGPILPQQQNETTQLESIDNSLTQSL